MAVDENGHPIMTWTREQKNELKVILEGLSVADIQSHNIIDKGYREWSHCGMLDKCVQLIELKVAGWETRGNSRCVLGYIQDELDILSKIRDRDKTDFQRGMNDAFNVIARKCRELCG